MFGECFHHNASHSQIYIKHGMCYNFLKMFHVMGRCGSGGRAVVWQSEGCRFDPTLGVSKCP